LSASGRHAIFAGMNPTPVKTCAICGRPQAEQFRPFCSRRCADVDLHRWLSGTYAIPAVEDDEDESPSSPDPMERD
jgi:endogenous inhibitor of DNA gyrase (YacG/DUF329 family)